MMLLCTLFAASFACACVRGLFASLVFLSFLVVLLLLVLLVLFLMLMLFLLLMQCLLLLLNVVFCVGC